MLDPSWLLGVPPGVLVWILVKCHIEVNAADIDGWEAAKLYFKCVIDALVPHGLPDPDRFVDEKED